jgi:hypothetical protein
MASSLPVQNVGRCGILVTRVTLLHLLGKIRKHDMMKTFNYYKRGKGELNTENFPDLVVQDAIHVRQLDSKTFVSLLALQLYKSQSSRCAARKQTLYVEGYVNHMRGDKDEFPVSTIYSYLHSFYVVCLSIQHESTGYIKSNILTKKEILGDLFHVNKESVLFIGADGSVPKFFPQVDGFATKVRKDGKVTSLSFNTDLDLSSVDCIVIVDDLLGGGATVQMLVDIIEDYGFIGDISLWVRYNEGIHVPKFLLSNFNYCYLGDEV